MSLFTVLKYGNTDLSSYTALSSLRSEFMYAYFKEVKKTGTLGNPAIAEDNLNFYYLANRLSYHYDTGNDSEKALLKRAFIKALEEFEEWWPPQ